METTLRPNQSTAVDNHLNHFLVSSAHWTADFLAQPPENFVLVSSHDSSRADSDGRIFITEESEIEDIKDCNDNSDGEHDIKPYSDTIGQDKERSIYRNIQEFRQGHLDHIFWRRGRTNPSPNYIPRRSVWPQMDWSKEFENKDDHKVLGAETHSDDSLGNSRTGNPGTQPNGTYVVTTDDKGNVKTSMSWRFNMRKDPSKL